ncbi:Galactosylgalactosylxylosylprotein 3-beta-glucuronosyltransferase 3 [Taenia solium]|eukprot:TsM_001066400 transcript=TsM_001066400 gene=TsM_001066400
MHVTHPHPLCGKQIGLLDILSIALVSEVLSECGVPYTHLFAMSPFRRRKRVRGSAQRNKGIEWIRNHPLPNTEKGIVFFADDDNTYDPRIFKEMLTTQLGSTWPVGLVGGSRWEGCITDPNDRSKIIDFWCIFRPWRQFPFDMAAFAVNARLFTLFPTARFDYHRALEQEGLILSQLGFHSAYELEPKADGCSKNCKEICFVHYSMDKKIEHFVEKKNACCGCEMREVDARGHCQLDHDLDMVNAMMVTESCATHSSSDVTSNCQEDIALLEGKYAFFGITVTPSTYSGTNSMKFGRHQRLIL